MEEQGAAWGRPIPQPTLYLHGTQDGCIALDAETAKGMPAFLGPGSEVERIEGVGHFMLVERPAEVNGRMAPPKVYESELNTYVKSLPNLQAYCTRMRERYYPAGSSTQR